MPDDTNNVGTLFGGQMISWMDRNKNWNQKWYYDRYYWIFSYHVSWLFYD